MNSSGSVPGKSLPASTTPSYSPAPPQSSTPGSIDVPRRQSQNSTYSSQVAPRKSQGTRKQHRNQKRPDTDETDDMAEIRAVRNASSRRGQTSITHLMNYSLPPRSYHDHHGSSSRSYRRNPSWGVGSGYHAMDKARYVHANYRFVVSPVGNYSVQAADADQHLDWSDVLQVIASTESQQTSCPICLSEPVAPRMAKCGHIFCLPCLIRFMNTKSNDEEDKRPARWRKCPICEDVVLLHDVRPVRFYAGQECPLPQPGHDVVLRLMTRGAHSTLALPKESGVDMLKLGDDIPWNSDANVLDYARIMKGTGAYMQAEFAREVDDLLKQEREDELLFHEETEWTQRAIKAVHAASEKVEGLGEQEFSLSAKAAAAPGQAGRANDHDFHFYMAPPHLYLSPLDIRILKTKYGTFSAFPSTLLPRVEHISTGHAVDDALRKRAKYLNHIPHGCLISFLECDWTDIVPAEVLSSFSQDIARRRKRNQDKANQEERERVQAERLDAAALRGGRRALGVVDEEVHVHFGTSPPEPGTLDLNDFQPLGMQATTPPNARPGFSYLSELDTSPTTTKTVWGTPAIPGSPGASPILRAPVDDGWLRDDVVFDSLEAADISVQMEALGVEDSTSHASSSAATSRSAAGGTAGAKKRKKQKITLMSTGGRRGN